MTRRICAILILGLVLPTLLIRADDPPVDPDKPGEGPPRLKRKKRSGDTEAPPKTEKKKVEDPVAPKAKDEEPLIPEDGGPGGEPEEDEKDILERIGKNMRGVEEKLGNRELGEPTHQQQQDILRDIDKLIKKSENGNQGGGGGQPPPAGGDEGDDKDQKDKQGGAKQSRAEKGTGPHGMTKGGQRQQRKQRLARQGRDSRGKNLARNQGDPGRDQPPANQGTNPGTNPGAGATGSDTPPPDVDRKTLNERWGHLPESLRAEMNAYSNPNPFLPRYDRLIREYYKTIAKTGRANGE